MTGKKKWKDHFLSSGVPLEYSVIGMLNRLEYLAPREFKYERLSEAGLPTQFSIDIYSSYIITELNLWLEVFIECKYRHEGTRWVFSPVEGDIWSPRHEDTLLVLDQYDSRRKIDQNKIISHWNGIPFCGKGIELLPSDHNSKSIEQAVQQLRYSLVGKAVYAINHQIDESLGSPTPLFLIAPIIVTTAELWRLKPNTTIEDIRNSDELEEVAQNQDVVLLHQDPDNFLIAHTRDYFKKYLGEWKRIKFDRALRTNTGNSYDNFIEMFSKRYPSIFIVVNYSYCERLMASLVKFIKDKLIIERSNSV
jgi:hypothetical protein